MKNDDLLMNTWLQWQMDNLSWLSSWMGFEQQFLQAAEPEVRALCEKLKNH